MPLVARASRATPFSRYRDYVDRIQRMALAPAVGSDWPLEVAAAMDGQARSELCRVASISARRKHGVFFTASSLCQKLLGLHVAGHPESTFYDPTCGMGDLLLAATASLPIRATLADTLSDWGERVAGTDLHPEFVDGAKARLLLMARERHGNPNADGILLESVFPNVRVADGHTETRSYQQATTVLMNPPFGAAKLPRDIDWAHGNASEAAIFVVRALERVRQGTEVLAILPDVLRSGSFSAKWRSRVSDLAQVHVVKLHGVFDDTADVDVFLTRLMCRGQQSSRGKRWPKQRVASRSTVNDHFHVHVGRVVPHRDPETGPRLRYVHPRCIPTWAVVREYDEFRRFSGLTYTPPFVVVRRTSRPGHRYRAAATVVAGREPVAVENHLLVCIPKDGTMARCKSLMRQLKTEAVNDFLDGRIRCRHLTVVSLAAVPFDATAEAR